MNKSELLETVKFNLSEKINQIQQLIDETRASNNDTKSSMGDKYETGREMLQQEINTLQIQLIEKQKAAQILQCLNTEPHLIIGNGSLVETDSGIFYIAVSLGEIMYEKSKIYVISLESPVGKIMQGKKTGDIFTLNSISRTIKKIW